MLIRLIHSGYGPREIIFFAMIMLFSMTLAFALHEFMHAFVANFLGDPTPSNMGRLTLNPASHVDPMGVVCMLIAGFGWGKPVPYNPTRLRKWKSRRGMVIAVNLAGVTGNFILALIFRILLVVVSHFATDFTIENKMIVFDNPVITALFYLCTYTYDFSMCLLAFNLLPIPPLDGFNVLDELLPFKVKYKDGYRKFIHYGPMALMIIFMISMFLNIDLLGGLLGLIRLPFELLITFITTPISLLLG